MKILRDRLIPHLRTINFVIHARKGVKSNYMYLQHCEIASVLSGHTALDTLSLL
jgi:hypothetical protein